VLGLTDEESEEERLHEMAKLMQTEANKKEEKRRIVAEEALLKARRQEEWVRVSTCCCNQLHGDTLNCDDGRIHVHPIRSKSILCRWP